MNNISKFDYNGQIISRRHDGFINLTQMCQANGKRLDNYTRLKQTQEYVRVLSQSLTLEVVQSEIGGTSPCTWGHPSLAINLARWISTEFAIWCDSHIFNLMSIDTTAIARHIIPQTYAEALLEAAHLAQENERLEQQNILLEQQNECLSEAVDELFNYSSIVRIAKFNGISETRLKWHRLKAVSTQMKLEIKKVPCPRFVEKNLYSHDAWRVAYPGIPLPETTTLVVQSVK